MTARTIKRLLKTYDAATAMADKAEAAWDAEPESDDLEAAFDAAYKVQWDAMEAVVKALAVISAGQIDGKTARLMVNGHREKLDAILARAA